MVKNLSRASLLFAIGYVVAVGISVILFPINPGLRSIIVFGIVQIVFMEMHYVYLSRVNCEVSHSFFEVIKVGTLWALMSCVLYILLFVLIIPLAMIGSTEAAFFSTQPIWYWFQFPMMIGTGLLARNTYIKVSEIRSLAAQKEEIIIS